MFSVVWVKSSEALEGWPAGKTLMYRALSTALEIQVRTSGIKGLKKEELTCYAFYIYFEPFQVPWFSFRPELTHVGKGITSMLDLSDEGVDYSGVEGMQGPDRVHHAIKEAGKVVCFLEEEIERRGRVKGDNIIDSD